MDRVTGRSMDCRLRTRYHQLEAHRNDTRRCHPSYLKRNQPGRRQLTHSDDEMGAGQRGNTLWIRQSALPTRPPRVVGRWSVRPGQEPMEGCIGDNRGPGLPGPPHFGRASPTQPTPALTLPVASVILPATCPRRPRPSLSTERIPTYRYAPQTLRPARGVFHLEPP